MNDEEKNILAKKEMDFFYEEMRKKEEKTSKKRTTTLNHIQDIMGVDYRNAVEDCLNECESCNEFKLVDKSCIKGNYQKEDWGYFDHIFVNQTTDGGYTGDEFAGYIYIPITKKLYLKSYYSM